MSPSTPRTPGSGAASDNSPKTPSDSTGKRSNPSDKSSSSSGRKNDNDDTSSDKTPDSTTPDGSSPLSPGSPESGAGVSSCAHSERQSIAGRLTRHLSPPPSLLQAANIANEALIWGTTIAVEPTMASFRKFIRESKPSQLLVRCRWCMASLLVGPLNNLGIVTASTDGITFRSLLCNHRSLFIPLVGLTQVHFRPCLSLQRCEREEKRRALRDEELEVPDDLASDMDVDDDPLEEAYYVQQLTELMETPEVTQVGSATTHDALAENT